jgi:hypothetical protein
MGKSATATLRLRRRQIFNGHILHQRHGGEEKLQKLAKADIPFLIKPRNYARLVGLF